MTFQARAQKVIQIEHQAIKNLAALIDSSFDRACQLIKTSCNRVIVIGIGKSGLVGNKIAATLASTGTPAFAVNAAEASHGDLGMIQKGDVVLAISYSGQTEEIIKLLPVLKKLDIPVISFCSNPLSPLATFAKINLNIGTSEEACPLGLAPTASTTATMVLGDALAIALLTDRGFTHEDFALSHPGGSLGKRLLVKVSDLMHKGDHIPIVHENDSLETTLIEITKKGLGAACVIDKKSHFIGIFTDGDLRRAFANNKDVTSTAINKIMTTNSQTTTADELAINALGIMEMNKITSLPVLNNDKQILGVLHMHALLSSGIQGAKHANTFPDQQSKTRQTTYS